MARLFSLWALLCACYSLFYGFEILAQTDQLKVAFAQLRVVCGTLLAPVWLFACLLFVERKAVLKRWWWTLLIAPLLLTLSFVVPGLDALGRGSEVVVGEGALRVVTASSTGILVVLNFFQTYVSVVLGILVLVLEFGRQNRIRKLQIAYIVVSVLLALGADLAYRIGLGHDPLYRSSMVFIAFAAITMAVAMYRYRLFDLRPLVNRLVMHTLHDLVLVFNEKGLLLNANAAACKTFGLDANRLPERRIQELLPELSEALILPLQKDAQRGVVGVRLNGDQRTYEWVSEALLLDSRDPVADLVLLRDITERERLNTEIQDRIKEVETLHEQLREQAIRDQLTDLYNRRYLRESFDRELARVHRSATPLSLMILDVDYFKQINDSFGHLTGDTVLRMVSFMLRTECRGSDTICRWGGDEFLVLMPDTTFGEAVLFSERIRTSMATMDIAVADIDRIFKITVSIGVSEWLGRDKTLDDLIERTDSALYGAKTSGRNKVCGEAGV